MNRSRSQVSDSCEFAAAILESAALSAFRLVGGTNSSELDFVGINGWIVRWNDSVLGLVTKIGFRRATDKKSRNIRIHFKNPKNCYVSEALVIDDHSCDHDAHLHTIYIRVRAIRSLIISSGNITIPYY